MLQALPIQKQREPAACVLSVRGRPLVELHPMLSLAQVECSRNQASVATLTFETRRDEHGRWPILDDEVLVPWEPLSVSAAFGTRSEEILRGYVRQVSAIYPESGVARVVVECQDESLAMDREHVRKAWGADVPTSDRVLVTAIAASHRLRVDVTSGAGQSGLVLHQDGTDIRFLQGRAEANGYELLFRPGELYFGPMRLGATAQPPLLVYAGPDTHCRSLTVTTDGHRPDMVAVDVAPTSGSTSRRREVKPDLPLLGAKSASTARPELRPFTWCLSREGSADEEALVARARGMANEASMRVRAEGVVDGTAYGHVLQVGLPVAVDGLGRWLSGTYYVDSVAHEFTPKDYRQVIRLLRNAHGDNLGGGAASVLRELL
jgi:hypothetical protein